MTVGFHHGINGDDDKILSNWQPKISRICSMEGSTMGKGLYRACDAQVLFREVAKHGKIRLES